MCRNENRSEPGEHGVNAQSGGGTSGCTGKGMQGIQIRLGQVLGMYGHRVHGHHIPSGGHVQDGAGTGRRSCRRPGTARARCRGSQGGGCFHHADYRPGKHERTDHNDCGKGVRHDQA